MNKLIASVLAALAASAVAQEVVIKDLGAARYAALISLQASENARREKALGDLNSDRFAILARINVQRDVKLPKLSAVDAAQMPDATAAIKIVCAEIACTAAEVDLAPVSAADVLVMLAATAMDKEAAAIEERAKAASATIVKEKANVALSALEAIKACSSDWVTKATAAGLDRAKISCK